MCILFYSACDGDNQDLHGLTHSFPTRRSSVLAATVAGASPRFSRLQAARRRSWVSQACGPIPVVRLNRAISWILRRPTSALSSSRSEEHTSELQSLMRISYAVFCLKNKTHLTLRQRRHLIKNRTEREKQ